MVYMKDSDFIQEHKNLPRILRSGTKAEREREATNQENEGKDMAEKKNEESKEAKKGHGIRRVEIEPAETGGFAVRVVHEQKESKGNAPVPYIEPDLHVCANTDQLSEFLAGCFPSPTARTKKGKSSTSEKGGSRVDTYENEDGDEKY